MVKVYITTLIVIMILSIAWTEYDEQGNRTEDQAPLIVPTPDCCECY